MLLEIRHESIYRYSTTANYSIQYARLMPRSDAGQRVLTWRIDAPGRRWRQTDCYGNVVDVISVVDQHAGIRIVAQGQIETADDRGHLIPADSAVPPLAFALPTPATEPDAAIRALAFEAFGECASITIGRTECEHLMALVGARMASRNGASGIHASAAEALAREGGTCQDMTHVFLAACRAGGVPARYVSGYVLDSRSAAASHAWAEAWIATAHRGAGAWLGFDVAHQRLSGAELCRLAIGRDDMDAGPLRGSRMGSAGEELTVSVSVSAAAGNPGR